MTFQDITNRIFNRYARRIERTIEVGAYIILTDGRAGVLDSVDMVQGEKRGYVIGEGFAASVTEAEIAFYKNVVELAA